MTDELAITLTLGSRAADMAVLSRVTASVAASVDLGIDRVAEAALVLEHIVGAARRRDLGRQLTIVFTPVDSGLDIRVGPVDPALALDVSSSPKSSGGALVARVVDMSYIEAGDGGDDIVLAFRHPVPQT